MEIQFLVKSFTFNHHQNLQSDFKYKIVTNYGLSYAKLNGNIFETALSVSIKDSKENPFPFDLELKISLLSKFGNDEISKKNLEDYLRFNSINILFPYLRSTITNLTSAAMVNPIVLPLINVNEVAKNIDLTNILKDL